ncbi:hypothetical protein B0T24DRAFT_122529 [Lasiosphaeria ovina]|uniref:Uncharacterized protein n=1 Tax=Lasiosphaeria ovina TaxID=92902 RepID=A0AAE0JSS3_9PEZI|nr:hypothetical protein B0T24DRAFT_122529 [Lasiosphaeria ovina]
MTSMLPASSGTWPIALHGQPSSCLPVTVWRTATVQRLTFLLSVSRNRRALHCVSAESVGLGCLPVGRHPQARPCRSGVGAREGRGCPHLFPVDRSDQRPKGSFCNRCPRRCSVGSKAERRESFPDLQSSSVTCVLCISCIASRPCACPACARVGTLFGRLTASGGDDRLSNRCRCEGRQRPIRQAGSAGA